MVPILGPRVYPLLQSNKCPDNLLWSHGVTHLLIKVFHLHHLMITEPNSYSCKTPIILLWTLNVADPKIHNRHGKLVCFLPSGYSHSKKQFLTFIEVVEYWIDNPILLPLLIIRMRILCPHDPFCNLGIWISARHLQSERM